jgi:hypothetical protein
MSGLAPYESSSFQDTMNCSFERPKERRRPRQNVSWACPGGHDALTANPSDGLRLREQDLSVVPWFTRIRSNEIPSYDFLWECRQHFEEFAGNDLQNRNVGL